MLEEAPRSGLPIYRNAIDWTWFDRQFPAPDVFANTIFKWPYERVRALQNQRFLAMMEVGWKNAFYQKSLAFSRHRAGRHPLDRRFEQAPDLQLRRYQEQPDRRHAVRHNCRDRSKIRAEKSAPQAADERRHDRQGETHALRCGRVGIERAADRAQPLSSGRTAGRHHPDSGDVFARQSRMVALSRRALLPRGHATHYWQWRRYTEPQAGGDRLRLWHDGACVLSRVSHHASRRNPQGTGARSPRAEPEVHHYLSRPRPRKQLAHGIGVVVRLPGFRQLRDSRDLPCCLRSRRQEWYVPHGRLHPHRFHGY